MRKILFSPFLALIFLTSAALADIYTVTNTNTMGAESLMMAIGNANNNPGPDKIVFNITAGSAPWTIQPTSGFPVLTDNGTHIDGTTQTGYAVGAPVIEIDGTSAGSPPAFTIQAANCTIEGLVINRFTGGTTDAIAIWGPNGKNNHIIGNFLGTNTTGTAALGNSSAGVRLRNGAQYNIIGGTSAAERNIISGNGEWGVHIMSANSNSNEVKGNYIGTDVNGAAAVGNGNDGVHLEDDARYNIIEANIISGNQVAGISLGTYETESAPKYNRITGNYIGIGVNGTADLGNRWMGVIFEDGAQFNTIGPNNVIAYNGIAFNWGGVVVAGTTEGASALYNTITQNSMFSNYGKGITLFRGGNAEIAYPVITSAIYSSGILTLSGTAPANSSIEIFLGDDCEGRTYEASTASDASGNWAWSGSVSGLAAGYLVTATATDSQGNTSGFAPCVQETVTTTTTTTSTTTTSTTSTSTSTSTSTTTTLPSPPTISIFRGGAEFKTGSAIAPGGNLNLTITIRSPLPISKITVALNDTVIKEETPQAQSIVSAAEYEQSVEITQSGLAAGNYILRITVEDSYGRSASESFDFTVLAELTALPPSPDEVTITPPSSEAPLGTPATLTFEIPSAAGAGYLILSTLPPQSQAVATIPVAYIEGKTILNIELINRVTGKSLSGTYLATLTYGGKKIWQKTILIPPSN